MDVTVYTTCPSRGEKRKAKPSGGVEKIKKMEG